MLGRGDRPSRSGRTAAPPRESYVQQLRPYLQGLYRSVGILIVASVVAGLSEAAILASVAQAATSLVNGAHRVDVQLGPLHLTESLGNVLGAAGALALLRLALQAPLSTIPAKLAADVQAGMQRRLFQAFTRASWGQQARAREGHLQELIMNQVLQATLSILGATSLLTSALTLFVLIASALLLNVVAAVAVLATAVALFALLRPLNQMTVRLSRGVSQAQMDMASGVGQAARLAEEMHVFDTAQAQSEEMDVQIAALREPVYRSQMLVRLAPGIYQSAIYLLVVGGLGLLYATHSGHVGSLGAVVLLLIRAGSYGQQVQTTYQGVRQARPFVERIQAATKDYDDSSPPNGTRRLSHVATMACDEVAFSYGAERLALSHVSFAVTQGEAIGIIGPSGAGKSTLVQILLQLRPPATGRYTINELPAEAFARADWYARVAYVPQEPRLLHASVADNIRFYRDIDDASIREAASLARIDADIAGWDRGYDTIIGPRADAVSGGQQQRICIARALAGHPEVLVLDEPTSALDPNSESLLQESLRFLKHRLTLFVVAHRMSTLDICDRVMVVMDGRVIDFDTPDWLGKYSAYYRSAWAIASGSSPVAASDGTANGDDQSVAASSSPATAPEINIQAATWVRRAK